MLGTVIHHQMLPPIYVKYVVNAAPKHGQLVIMFDQNFFGYTNACVAWQTSKTIGHFDGSNVFCYLGRNCNSFSL